MIDLVYDELADVFKAIEEAGEKAAAKMVDWKSIAVKLVGGYATREDLDGLDLGLTAEERSALVAAYRESEE
jgi:hypothetical protein